MNNTKTYINPDLHMHSSYSDGTDDPKTLLENVKKNHIDIFALTDHDTYLGCLEMEHLLKENDPYFIGGVELSCEDEFGKYHILGYCYDVNKESIKNVVDYTHNSRIRKMEKRINYLKEFNMTFSKEDIDKLYQNTNPGKPHLVKLMIKYGYVKDMKEGFDLLDKYNTFEKPLSPIEAIDAIFQADGIAVLAHGLKGSGSQNLTFEEMEERVKRLKSYGLIGLECYYEKFTEDEIKYMISLAEKYNLLITAGSDYHGKNKPAKLGDTHNPKPEHMKRFYRNVELLLKSR